MKVAFITRSTLHSVPGGDSVQVLNTATFLKRAGLSVDVCLTHEKIDYKRYDLFHFTNIIRPSDILFHVNRIRVPYVVSPVLVDYAEYDRSHRSGLAGSLLKHLPAGANEYVKTIARWVLRKDHLRSKRYLVQGQHRSIRQILSRAAMLLPNSASELQQIETLYRVRRPFEIVPNGIDESLFAPRVNEVKESNMVFCAARIEGIKNQFNLIRALNNTPFTLVLAGAPAPNQRRYYERCRNIAATNVHFHEHLPQEKLVAYYRRAKVHALPSWFETCGLSSLEAAAMGCNLAITDKGFTRDYFGDDAFYCDPASPESIRRGIEAAAKSECNRALQNKVLQQFTWQRAAALTLAAYKKIFPA